VEANTAIGVWALRDNFTGGGNTASGASALRDNVVGNHNTASGANALRDNLSGNNNTASGSAALTRNTTGSQNTASGEAALARNASGDNNTASGYRALSSNPIGSGNTANGANAFFNMTAGSNNLALGVNAGLNLTTGNNNIYLRNGGAVTETNTIRIGSKSHSRAFIGGIRGIKTGVANAVPVVIDANGQLGTVNSSARFKKDIQDMSEASRKLLELRPVTYRYKQASEDGSNPLEYGLIAEEVEKVYPGLVAYGADGKIETVQYQKLTPMLVNEVKRLNKLLQTENDKVFAQSQEIVTLKQQTQKIAFQEKEISELKQKMTALQTQAKNIEALTSRLSRIESKGALGLTEKITVKPGQNPG
jgi:hypothetical protein